MSISQEEYYKLLDRNTEINIGITLDEALIITLTRLGLFSREEYFNAMNYIEARYDDCARVWSDVKREYYT